MTRFDIINTIIARRFPANCRYLELGYALGLCFREIRAPYKASVDPGSRHGTGRVNGATFQVTTDEFFATHTEQWDVVFIDALHVARQVWKDLANVRKVISPNGFIVLHDCSPPNVIRAHDDPAYYEAYPSEWNGDVFRAWYRMRCEWPYANACVDTDEGCGIISMGKAGTPISHTNEFYSYSHMAADRCLSLGLISPATFLEKFDELF
jgi:hypothetical protein